MNREMIARGLHNKYNELAIKAGWKIQTCCEAPFEALPTANQEVMLGMADFVLALLPPQLSVEEIKDIIERKILKVIFADGNTNPKITDIDLDEIAQALATKLKGEGTEEKPFNEKYGLEIAGKFVPFKDLPTDINELKDLIKTAEEKGLEIMLTASGLGHRNCEYKMFNQTNKVSITEVEWLILCEILDIKDKLISLGAVNSAEKKERT